MKLEDIQKCALDLPESERAMLAAELLTSLPATLVDDDDGLAEAMRRSRELDENPSLGRSWDDIKRSLGRLIYINL